MMMISVVYTGNLNGKKTNFNNHLSLVIRSNDNTLPTGGDWRIDGCQLIGINRSIATCICNHLTHFAILLSPGAMVNIII